MIHTRKKAKTIVITHKHSVTATKVKSMAALRNTAIDQHWDACALLRRLSLVQENPPGTGLATHRSTVQISWRDFKTQSSTTTLTPLS